MAITYDAPNNIITVIGYTEGTPCTFEDIYQADQAGGWGVVSKQGAAQYLFDCRLKIANNTVETYFADTEKQVTFSAIAVSGNSQILIEVERKGHFRLGVLDDETEKLTSKGCDLTKLDSYTYTNLIAGAYWNMNPDVHLYSCHFTSTVKTGYISEGRDGIFRIWNCILDNANLAGAGYKDGYNLLISNSTIEGISYSTGTFDRIDIVKCFYGVTCREDVQSTLKNCRLRQNTIAVRLVERAPNTYDQFLVNFDVDNWVIYWHGNPTKKIYRQYEFDLTVADKENTAINGATVTLKDKNGTQVFQVTTDANGKITTQTVSRGWYEKSTGNTLNDLSPHELIIEKAGYQTYQKKFVLESKTSWQIKLAKAIGVFLDLGRPVINLKKSDPENKNVMVL